MATKAQRAAARRNLAKARAKKRETRHPAKRSTPSRQARR